jgi:LacI family transcriptional regulator
MDIQQVAKLANVSTATVSRVLNASSKVRPATAERVQRIIDELHYVPNTSARSLRVGRSRLLGLIVSDINNPFFPELIDAFESQARTCGIDVIFTHTNYDSLRLEHCLQRLVERNVDGIAVCTSETNRAAFEFAAKRKMPLVLMNQEGNRTEFANIQVDHNTGAEQAIRHLHELGHRSIGFISGPRDFDSTRDRYRAFLRAMKRCELQVDPAWIMEGDLHLQSGHEAMHRLLALPKRPTAILSTNDMMAVGALQAAHAAGVAVPEQMSMVGFDNLPVCEMVTPPLTSVDIPRRDIAAAAFSALMQAAEDPAAKPSRAMVKTQLVVRGSTAKTARLRA